MTTSQPIINPQSLTLPEHKSEDILALKLYLILGFRVDEAFPSAFMVMRGADIAQQDLHKDHYKFYLLPQ